VARTNDLGKLALKRIELRADGCDPVGLERFEYELNLGTADVRGRKVKARHSVLKV
jgi:hypothetical protein